MTYYNGSETTVFTIIGDGEVLYEHRFSPVDFTEILGKLPADEWQPIAFDIDISGVDVLTIKYYGTNDYVRGNYTISDLGLVDFLLHHE